MRDTRHAANTFGANKSALNIGTPRFPFQYFVNFTFNPAADNYVKNFLGEAEDVRYLTALVKSVSRPGFTTEEETLDQYNRRRIIQKRVQPGSVEINMHDTVEGRTLRFWEMYYEYYFRDGVNSKKLDSNNQIRSKAFVDDLLLDTQSDGDYGYNIERVGNQRQLIRTIDIFQVHSGNFTQTTLINPKISSFTPTNQLDYAGTELLDLMFTINCESVVYSNYNEPLTDEELARYRNGDFWQMSSLITFRTRTKAPGRSDSTTVVAKPAVNVCGDLEEIELGVSASPDAPQLATESTRNLGPLARRIQSGIDNIASTIPDAVAGAVTSTVFGGKISFSPNPLKAIRSTANQEARRAVDESRENFRTTVSRSVRRAVTGRKSE